MKRIALATLALLIALSLPAQQKTDTVVVELAKGSRVVFTMKDKADLPILRQYDFQALFTDILNKVDTESTVATTTATEPSVQQDVIPQREEVVWEENGDDTEWTKEKSNRYSRGSRHSVNFDLGVNNYLSNNKFPDADELYAVRPWGSWYVGINSVQRSRIGGKFFIEWGLGLSWYNFKFESDDILLSKDENGVIFSADTRDVGHIKSKLSASYVNASFVPMLDFGGRGRKTRFWDSHGSNFRIGVGPYAGYRISSRSKLVYKDDGREKEKDRDNFYINNFRYGIRVQLGIRSTDLFFNYDLNEFFTNKPNNPKLNAFSFGVIF